jgi:hypothetical protein
MNDTNATETVTKSSVDILAELALEEKAEKAAAAKEAKSRYKEMYNRRRVADKNRLDFQERVYAACDHLQGNSSNGQVPLREVPDLSHHTYSNNVQRIRCNKCTFQWFPGDTQDEIVRNKQTRINPTGLSWKDVSKLVKKFGATGNKPSKGFVTVTVVPPTQE